MKGIILAGGSGRRLYPVTLGTSKQLLPIYNKPLIYYPLSTLMLAGIRDILVVCSPGSLSGVESLLGTGEHLGMSIRYVVQTEPRGLADAYIVGADHIKNDNSALVLGDNIFHGSGFRELLAQAMATLDGCVLFGYPVNDPERYGIADVDDKGRLVSVLEKPESPPSNNAVTGLYFYDPDVVEIASELRPSPRGEIEITDVNQCYIDEGRAHLIELGRGFTWLDAGTYHSLLEASHYVQVLANRQGVEVACVEEIALRMGYITAEECHALGTRVQDSEYGRYVQKIAVAVGSDTAGRTP